MNKTAEIFVGIDVSKAWLDVAVHESKTIFFEISFLAGSENFS